MYIDSVMNYTGSKFKLLDQILPEFDYSKKTFIDLFCGGGSVYINVLDKYDKVIANDIIKELIDIHKSLLTSDDIIESTKLLCPGKDNKEGFLQLRESFNKSKSPNKLWALMLSCTNNMMRFNNSFQFNQSYGDRGWNDSINKKVNIFKNHIREFKDKIEYNSINFNDVDIKSNSFVYIDPPYGYIIKNGAMGNKQISEAGYNCYWSKEDEINLYNKVKNIHNSGSSFMISGVLEHGGERSWILDKLIQDGFSHKELNFNYNGISKKGNKNTKEIIVKNY
jgi:DNA adenine methylase Dam